MMPSQKPKKAVILIPLTFNDGSKIPDRLIRDIRWELFSVFDGWTFERAVEGAYRMASGRQRVEKHVRVSVVLFMKDLPRLRKMVGRWCARLKQESMYLEIVDAEIEFIRPLVEEE